MCFDKKESAKMLPILQPPPQSRLLTRRELIFHAGAGFSGLALAHLLDREGLLAAAPGSDQRRNPLAPKQSHFRARAKSVIFLFMYGGPSQIDLFDPKPELARHHGQPMT